MAPAEVDNELAVPVGRRAMDSDRPVVDGVKSIEGDEETGRHSLDKQGTALLLFYYSSTHHT